MEQQHVEDNGDRRVGDFNRPRRPNPDTVAYLRSLPIELKASDDEVSHYLLGKEQGSDEENPEYPQILGAALSAIDEIRNEIASLAGDEYGSQGIELLARIAVPYSEVAARTLLFGLSTYHLHLATHRYGSHVVQTILELSVSSSCDDDLALQEDSPQLSTEQLPSLSDLILGVIEELVPHASELVVHVCGSHVLRTLLCVLGGVKLVSGPGDSVAATMRRGKVKSKKKKRKKPVEANDSPRHAGIPNMEYRTGSRGLVESSTEEALSTFTSALCGSASDGPGELQQLTCHPSAGPLLIVLLRVLTYFAATNKYQWQKGQRQTDDTNHCIADYRLGIVRPEPIAPVGSLADHLVKRLLCWQEIDTKQPFTGDVIYGMSGEPRGSHVLETMMRLCSDEMYGAILDYGDFCNPSTMKDYVEHDVSNFVVQSLLCTVRSKEQAEKLWKSLERTVTCGYVLDPGNKRRSILWRATEMAAKFCVCQDSVLKSIRVGMGLMGRSQDEACDESATTEDGTKKKKKQRQKASSLSMQSCVPKLLDVKPPEADGGRVALDVAGARTLYNLLRFAPRLCSDVLEGVIENLSVEELVWIAKDGLGSRW